MASTRIPSRFSGILKENVSQGRALVKHAAIGEREQLHCRHLASYDVDLFTSAQTSAMLCYLCPMFSVKGQALIF